MRQKSGKNINQKMSAKMEMFRAQDREIQTLRLHIVLMENNQCFIIDVALPRDARVTEKEIRKISGPEIGTRKAVEYNEDCCPCGDWPTGIVSEN